MKLRSPATQQRVEEEGAAARCRDQNQLVEDALQQFLDRRQRREDRVQACAASPKVSMMRAFMTGPQR